MAFLLYRKRTSSVVGWWETEEEVSWLEQNRDNFILIEQEYDPTTDYSLSMTLSEDGTSLYNRHAGMSLDEQRAAVAAETETSLIAELKEKKTALLNGWITDALQELNWKITRAKDRDLINGNTEAMDAVLAEKESYQTTRKRRKSASTCTNYSSRSRRFYLQEFLIIYKYLKTETPINI